MKSKTDKTYNTYMEDYDKIMKDFLQHNNPISQTPQWTNPSDFIIKFSLYQETPNSITSTDTLVNI